MTQHKLVKPREDILHPNFNELYGALRVNGGWQYVVENYATGQTTLTGGATVAAAVVLKNAPNWKLNQWPGANQFYLCIRSFSLTSQNISTAPTEVSVPATAGNITLFTGPGTLQSIEVTTTGASALNFQDGAGNIIATIPGGSAAGFVLSGNFGFQTSLVAQKSATTPVVTASYTPQVAGGAIDVLYQDINSGYIIPLGEFNNLQNSNEFNMNSLIPVPITDLQLQTIGQLLITLDANAVAGLVNWQIGVSAAYLIPQLDPYTYRTKGSEHDRMHSSMLD